MYNRLKLTYGLGYSGVSQYALDLNDGVSMRVEQWVPHVGGEGDIYVTETIELMIYAEDRSIIYKRRQELDFIVRLAKEAWEEKTQFPVYLEINLPGMTESRRTQIVDGRVELADQAINLDELGNRFITGRLIVTRLNWFEGAYKTLNIYGANQISSTVVRLSNRVDNSTTTANNGIKILGTDLEGDLPGFIRVHIVQNSGSGWGMRIFRGRSYEDNDANYLGYRTHVAEGETIMSSSVADATSNGAYYGSVAVTSSYTNIMVASAITHNVDGWPPGWYALYARHPNVGNWTGWRIKGSINWGQSVNNPIATFEADVGGFMRLCSFYLPSGKFGKYTVYNSLYIEIEAKITPSGGNYLLDNLMIVPLDDTFSMSKVLLPGSSPATTAIDEAYDFSLNEGWLVTNTSEWDIPNQPSQFGIIVGGPLTLVPRRNNYLYFFQLDAEEGDTGHTLTLSNVFDVGVGYRPRYRTL